MAIYLLDTSVIIDVLNQKRGRWQLLGSLVEAGDTLACSVVTLTEIYAGVRPKEVVFTERFLEGLEHYDLDSHLARLAGLLKNEWSKKGRTLGVVDLIIAATALAHNLVLMTDNRKDFPMRELSFYPLP
ncbi:MAG TPA: type II toxin-antitoxin system VapC family toxin [Bryobacteraceae bacterium]|jgi:predicted nucleic acid-binding protein|nr:type II toxin-antitoxin system VapC family toxin [Bryobacteraceae bacterium]